MKSLYILIFLFVSISTFGQTTFQRTYQIDDRAHIHGGMSTASDGGFYLISLYSDIDEEKLKFHITKHNFKGNLDWSSDYEIEERTEFFDLNVAIKETDDKGVVFCALERDPDTGGGMVSIVVKLDDEGNVEWSKTLGTENEGDFFGPGIATLASNFNGGSIYANLKSDNSDDQTSAYLAAFNNDGDVEWANLYKHLDEEGLEGEFTLMTAFDECIIDSTYIMAGTLENEVANYSFLTKVDIDGNLLWAKKYLQQVDEGFINQVTDVSCGVDTSYVISGLLVDPVASIFSTYVSKMDIDGNELWSNIIQVPGTLPLTSQVLSDSGNNVFVSGKALSLLDGTQNEYLIRLTSLGELVWSKTFPRINSFFFDPTAGFLLGGDLEQTGGEYLLTGGALDPDLGALYPFAVKFDDLGTTMCEEDLTVSLNDTLLTYEVDTLFWMSKELMNVSEDSIIRERFNEYNLPIVSLLDTTFCPQDPIMVTLDATANFALSYEWENGDTTAMRDVTEEGDYMVTVTFDTLACFQLCDTSTISVFEFPTVNINLNNGEFCETGEFFLSAGVSQGNPAYIYEWSTGEETATISVTEFGDYLVTVTDQCDNSSTNQVNVSEANLPEPIIPNSEINADSYCDPDREIFLINTPSGGVGPYTFMWDTGETGPNIAVTAFGEYNVTISDSCNESIVQVFTVDESILPTPDVINLVKDTETFCETEAITINIANANAGFVNVVWSNGETNVSSIDVNQPGIYTVEGMDCNQPVSASIEVEAGDFPEGLKFPNIFSPTDIDSNRSFGPFVECPDIIEDYELKVFDRWGKMVFESQSVDVRWNGAVGTKSQPSEVFYWYATYNTPAGEVLLEGDVTLIR